MKQEPHISVRGIAVGYGSFLVLRDVSFDVHHGDVFVIMGGSGSGKSTLLQCLVGLLEPREGEVRYGGKDFTHASADERQKLRQRFGVLFQSGALFSGMTVAENVALPLEEFTDLRPTMIREIVDLKLTLVGLRGFEDFYPAQLSGGMQKRAGLARAMALDPEILFLDEPSSGLDPVTADRLDDLILEVAESIGTTMVVVTHDLSSIFKIANDSIYLDAKARTIAARGPPDLLLRHGEGAVRNFLTRGGTERSA